MAARLLAALLLSCLLAVPHLARARQLRSASSAHLVGIGDVVDGAVGDVVERPSSLTPLLRKPALLEPNEHEPAGAEPLKKKRHRHDKDDDGDDKEDDASSTAQSAAQGDEEPEPEGGDILDIGRVGDFKEAQAQEEDSEDVPYRQPDGYKQSYGKSYKPHGKPGKGGEDDEGEGERPYKPYKPQPYKSQPYKPQPYEPEPHGPNKPHEQPQEPDAETPDGPKQDNEETADGDADEHEGQPKPPPGKKQQADKIKVVVRPIINNKIDVGDLLRRAHAHSICSPALGAEPIIEDLPTLEGSDTFAIKAIGATCGPKAATLGGGSSVECDDEGDLAKVTLLSSQSFAAPALFVPSSEDDYPVQFRYRIDEALAGKCRAVIRLACCEHKAGDGQPPAGDGQDAGDKDGGEGGADAGDGSTDAGAAPSPPATLPGGVPSSMTSTKVVRRVPKLGQPAPGAPVAAGPEQQQPQQPQQPQQLLSEPPLPQPQQPQQPQQLLSEPLQPQPQPPQKQQPPQRVVPAPAAQPRKPVAAEPATQVKAAAAAKPPAA